MEFWRIWRDLDFAASNSGTSDGSPIFASVTDNAELTVISRRDTFKLIKVHTNVKL